MKIIHLHFTTLWSTNAYAIEHPELFVEDQLTVISADHQRAGRGRMGRHWHSAPSKNVLASFAFLLPQTIEVEWIGLILACAVTAYLQAHGLQVLFKWPNDLFVNGKKIAGILVETRALGEDEGVVVGIGLNVNASRDELAEVGQSATSLLMERGQQYDLEMALSQLAEGFESRLRTYMAGGLQCIIGEIQSLKPL